MAKVKVHVFLKPGVLDVQGKAVEGALQGLGWAGVSGTQTKPSSLRCNRPMPGKGKWTA